MPLSDDELSELEAHYQNDRVGFDILALQRNDKVLNLIAEVRASRPVVGAAKGVANNPDTWGWDYDVPSHARLRDALTEYEAANAEPQKV